jgi:hypothetical protein
MYDTVLRAAKSAWTGIFRRRCAVDCCLLAAFLWVGIDPWPERSIRPDFALQCALDHGITGNVFNDYNFGGYLIAHHVLTFIDGRGVIFGDLFRKYLTGKITDNDLDRYGVTWALLRPDGHMSDRWESLCADDIAVVWRPRPA